MEREPNPPPISDQRTLFLVNTFVIHTVRLLNNFAVICEDKLADVHRRILRVDATLSLLEAKLGSVDASEGSNQPLAQDSLPDLAHPPETPLSPEPELHPELHPEQSTSSRHAVLPNSAGQSSSSVQSELSRVNSVAALVPSDQSEHLKAKDDPHYARFYRMLQVGVPLPAVKMQMSIEGLDGSVLDNPEEATA